MVLLLFYSSGAVVYRKPAIKVAHHLHNLFYTLARQAAWYSKELPTFSDTLAFVRQQLWPVSISWMSGDKGDVVIIPRALFERLTDTLAYAA